MPQKDHLKSLNSALSLFIDGEYEEAEKLLSDIISSSNTHELSHGNESCEFGNDLLMDCFNKRSAARIKLGKYQEAKCDAIAVLEIDKDNSFALVSWYAL